MSLDDDLAALEADDPEVRAAAQRLDETRESILSTSAQLRAVQDAYARTQAALAASQADLTHVEGQLREAEKELYATQRLVDQKQERLGEYSDLLTGQHVKTEQAERERDLARAELASARQEIGHQRGLLDEVIAENSRMRHRIAVAGEHRVDVARADLTAPCGDCGGPILRGHAVERIPTTDLIRHLACPDKEN